MNKIISKEHFSEKVFKLVIEAPLIAKSRKAGHFVIVRVGEKGERMPLTIAEADPVKGTITLVVQEVGLSSTRLCELNEGDYITDVVGPLFNTSLRYKYWFFITDTPMGIHINKCLDFSPYILWHTHGYRRRISGKLLSASSFSSSPFLLCYNLLNIYRS